MVITEEVGVEVGAVGGVTDGAIGVVVCVAVAAGVGLGGATVGVAVGITVGAASPESSSTGAMDASIFVRTRDAAIQPNLRPSGEMRYQPLSADRPAIW